MKRKSKDELEDYLKALSRCLWHLEDMEKEYMSQFEYIIFQEWKRVNKLIKGKSK
jgi:hypothetical protein